MATIYGRPQSEKALLDKYPRKVQKIGDIKEAYRKLKAETSGTGLLGAIRNWGRKRQIEKFDRNWGDPMHAGATGELKVLERLSELDGGYRVLCGLNIRLPRYAAYGGQTNLRSAQMDFVVVSRRGVVLIEVKNWSSGYYSQHRGLSPYEQADRAGEVLRIALKSWRSPRNPPVTRVLLPIQNNMPYSPRYRHVSVSGVDGINSLIESHGREFSEKEAERITGRLKGHVTR